MDFHALSRRDLQALSKRNGIRANQTNAAMADALAKLPAVDGVEEYIKESVAEPTAAAEPEVQAVAEEEEAPAEEVEEEKGERQKQGISPQEVIVLDDSEEEEKDEEKAPALATGRRRATRRARIEPVAAPATRKKTAASKAEKGDAAAEAVPARATRARGQKTVSAAEEEEPKARPTTRRAVTRKTATEQEEEEEATQGGVSDAEAAVPAPASSGEGNDGAEEIEAVTDAQNDEQVAAPEAKTAEAVPARATRGRSRRTVVSVPEEEAPKARRTSSRAVVSKTSTEHEAEGKGTQGDASDTETAAPARVSSDERGDGAEVIEVAIHAHNEEQTEQVEEEPVEAAEPRVAVLPARTTRSKRTVVPVADEVAPKARRTSRRALARRTSTEQEEEEKGTQCDVSDMEAAVPAPASSEEGGDGAEETEATIDAQNEEQFAVAEVVPPRATRARSKRTVVPVAEEEVPMPRRTSRTRRTGTTQEEEGQGQQQQDMATDVGAAVPAPVHGAEETEADLEPQNEEQTELVEEQSEEDEGILADRTLLEEEQPVAEDCPVDSSIEEQTDTVSSEEIQQSSEDTEMMPVQEVPLLTPKSGEIVDGVDFIGDAGEENEDGTYEEPQEAPQEATEEIQLASEDAEMVPVNEVPQVTVTSGEATVQADFTNDVDHGNEENEDCTAEEPLVGAAVPAPVHGAEETEADLEPQNEEQTELVEEQSEEDEGVLADRTLLEEEQPVAEDCPVDSSIEEQTDTVSSEEIQQSSEDTEMMPVHEVPLLTPKSGEAVDGVDFIGDVGEENEDGTYEEPQEAPQEATEEIQLASEDAEMVPVNEVPQVTVTSGEATVQADFTNDVDHGSEENEDCTAEEPLVEEHVDSSVQELPVDAQQCEDAEMVPVDEVPQATLTSGGATEEADFTSDADHDSEEKEDCTVEEETPVATDVDSPVQELMVDVQATKEIHFAREDTEILPVNEVIEEVCFTSYVVHGSEENEVPTCEEVLQSAAKASEKKQDIAAENLSQATVTNDEGTVKVSDFSSDLEDVSVEEMTQSSATLDEGGLEVLTLENLSQATVTDNVCADVSIEEDEGVVTVEEMTHSSAMDDSVQQEVTVDNLSQGTVTDLEDAVQEVLTATNLSQATVTDDEGVVKESGFAGELMDVSVEEEVTATEEMLHSSVKESAFAGARDFNDHITSRLSANVFEHATKYLSMDSITVKESGFTGELMDVSVEEQGVLAADQIPHSSATKDENVEKVVTMENLSQAKEGGVTMENLSQAKEGGVTGELQPVAFSDHIASPLSANVFEDATKSLSMDSIAAKPTVSEPAAVPLCTYTHSSDGKMKITEPMSVQVKVAKKPEALGSLSVRKLKLKLKAGDVPLCIYSNSGSEKNTSEPVCNESDALGSLSLRKLRTELNEIVAVAQENEVNKVGDKSSVPLDTLSLRKLRLRLKETLNAQKNREPTRVPLGRLDENAC